MTGQPYRDVLAERLFRPLRMEDTYFNVPNDKRSRLSSQYRRDAAGAFVQFRKRGQEEAETGFYSGAGGLRSTVRDY